MPMTPYPYDESLDAEPVTPFGPENSPAEEKKSDVSIGVALPDSARRPTPTCPGPARLRNKPPTAEAAIASPRTPALLAPGWAAVRRPRMPAAPIAVDEVSLRAPTGVLLRTCSCAVGAAMPIPTLPPEVTVIRAALLVLIVSGCALVVPRNLVSSGTALPVKVQSASEPAWA